VVAEQEAKLHLVRDHPVVMVEAVEAERAGPALYHRPD
jgi:hypothetical protein